jgi:hypothetical protein
MYYFRLISAPLLNSALKTKGVTRFPSLEGIFRLVYRGQEKLIQSICNPQHNHQKNRRGCSSDAAPSCTALELLRSGNLF